MLAHVKTSLLLPRLTPLLYLAASAPCAGSSIPLTALLSVSTRHYAIDG